MTEPEKNGTDAPTQEAVALTVEQRLTDIERRTAHIERIVFGDPTAEHGRQRGLAELVVEVHSAVFEILARMPLPPPKLPGGVSGGGT